MHIELFVVPTDYSVPYVLLGGTYPAPVTKTMIIEGPCKWTDGDYTDYKTNTIDPNHMSFEEFEETCADLDNLDMDFEEEYEGLKEYATLKFEESMFVNNEGAVNNCVIDFGPEPTETRTINLGVMIGGLDDSDAGR